MRITTGQLKGRQLLFPKSKQVRPTSEKVRKAIFDVLGDFVEDKNVLDLFSGSGALGLEALSRGARKVFFVEKRKESLLAIRKNICALKVQDKSNVIAGDVFASFSRLERKNEKFEVIIADPPYYEGLARKCLLEICRYDIVNPPTVIIIEHNKKDELPKQQENYLLWQLKKYGDTFVSMYR